MPLTVSIKLSPETARFLRKVGDTLGAAKLRRELIQFNRKQAQKAAGTVIKTQLSGQALRRRTGTLARSTEGRVDTTAGRLPAMRIGIFRGPATRYAAVQEFGTKGKNPASPIDTIRPVKAKALAIPINDSLTGAGVAKFVSPRSDPRDLVFIPFARNTIVIGALFERDRIRIAQKRALGDLSLRDVKAAYLLMTQVDVAPTFWLSRGVNLYIPTYQEELLDFLEDFIVSERI